VDLDSLNSSSKLVGLLLGLGTVGVGGLALWTETRINARQSDRIRSAELAIIEARTELAKAKTEQVAAETRLKSVETNLEAQRERAATAERKLLELQQRVQPRRLLGSQRQRLVAALRESAIKGHVHVTFPIGDGEAARFSADIQDVLRDAGWSTNKNTAGAMSGIGMGLRVRDVKRPPAHAGPLQRAFRSAGIEIEAESDPAAPEDMVHIFVLSKP
jgi:hypothetical protein